MHVQSVLYLFASFGVFIGEASAQNVRNRNGQGGNSVGTLATSGGQSGRTGASGQVSAQAGGQTGAGGQQSSKGGVQSKQAGATGGQNGQKQQGTGAAKSSQGGTGSQGGAQAKKTGGGGGGGASGGKAGGKSGGVTANQDGTMTLDKTVQINGLPIRYKVSGPPEAFTQESGVQGGQAAAGTAGTVGLNVLLHGDGGQSFFAFPNEGVKDGLAGVAVLSPDPNLKWGGSGDNRPDGPAHSQAVADLITNELSNDMAFDSTNVWFTGVSGGALTLAGSFIPAHMGQFPNAGVALLCGGMPPQQFTAEASQALTNTTIHFQSTTQELDSLQGQINQAIGAYKQAGAAAGMSTQDINTLQTADNHEVGGHYEFDGQSFDSGVQLEADNFANFMFPGGSGVVNGANVKGNDKLTFSKGKQQRRV